MAPLVTRLPSPVMDRLPGVDLPDLKPWAAAGSGSSSDLTRPLYLQLFLPAHPQQRRAPPA
ncbi:MAG TPA: hypothetical protein VNM14_10475 [Planctomycetota bacterium]|nr:hypothetical protein [Planctomycetota bacterium]